MSISLYWQPVVNGSLIEGSSTTKQALERAFGSFPLELKSSDIPKLEGLMAAKPEERGYASLVEALCDHREIMVWSE